MKKFIHNSSLFVLLATIIITLPVVLMYLKSPDTINTWYYGENTKKGRIIIVGSSNVYTNYDYIKLNKTFPKYDVIGVSIAASVGFIPLITKLNQLQIKSTYIIIFCLPYQLYDSTYLIRFDNDLALNSVTKNSIINGIKYNSTQTLLNFYSQNKFSSFYRYIISEKPFECKATSLKFEKSQSVLLSQNDYINCVKQVDAGFIVESKKFDKLYLQKFMTSILNNIEARVFFRFPAIHKGKTTINEEKLTFLTNNFAFINSFSSSFYDSIFWYDNSYHLNQCGAHLNSSLLIIELQTKLNLK